MMGIPLIMGMAVAQPVKITQSVAMVRFKAFLSFAMMALPMRVAAAMQIAQILGQVLHVEMATFVLKQSSAMTVIPMRVVAAMPTAPRLVVGRRVATVNRALEFCDDGYADACGSCNADCTEAGSGAVCGDGDFCRVSSAMTVYRWCGSCNESCTAIGAGATCGDAEICPELEPATMVLPISAAPATQIVAAPVLPPFVVMALFV